MKRTMKKVFIRMIRSFEKSGRARAAEQLANMGYKAEAKELLLQK